MKDVIAVILRFIFLVCSKNRGERGGFVASLSCAQSKTITVCVGFRDNVSSFLLQPSVNDRWKAWAGRLVGWHTKRKGPEGVAYYAHT